MIPVWPVATNLASTPSPCRPRAISSADRAVLPDGQDTQAAVVDAGAGGDFPLVVLADVVDGDARFLGGRDDLGVVRKKLVHAANEAHAAADRVEAELAPLGGDLATGGGDADQERVRRVDVVQRRHDRRVAADA